jgi:phospholipid N-methyltransferase
MLNFPQAMRQALLSQALAAAGEKIFVQLTFSFRPPIAPPAADIAVSGQMVWKNFPPAHVWTYRGRSCA